MGKESTKVKLIRVMPNQKLSLQKHNFRSEKWFVVQGKAKVTREDEQFTFGKSVILLILRRNKYIL
ncbi:MAG: hypothetical protein Ct9H300mP3_10040 [Gammaproteobacteria bacterium]|nr:MAG: hypothetical protein Ct9H300mP3_10040 [Gammaproteobacteria bacterium]